MATIQAKLDNAKQGSLNLYDMVCSSHRSKEKIVHESPNRNTVESNTSGQPLENQWLPQFTGR